MSYTDNEVILPVKAMAFNIAYSAPMLNLNAPAPNPYGRMSSSYAFGNIGGIPSLSCKTYDRLTLWAFQLTRNNMYAFPIDKTTSVNTYQGLPYIQNNLHVMVESRTKGMQWLNSHFFYNYGGFPNPALPDGVIVDQWPTVYYNTGMCFAEGSISCNTVMGNPFPAVFGPVYDKHLIYNPGAGCPAVNNWGVSYTGVENNKDSFTISDGSGLGTQPFLRQADIGRAFAAFGSMGAVQVAPGLVAYLNDDSYGDNGTILTVCKYFAKITKPDTTDICGGDIEINMYPIYQRNLQDLAGGSAGHANCKGLWSDENGTLGVMVSNDSFRRLIFIKFPGPVVQVISQTSVNGGAPLVGGFPFIDKDGYVGIMMDWATYGPATVYFSTAAISLDYSVTKPINPDIYDVRVSDTTNIININRSF